MTVTLPGARYGVISAALVVFTLVLTDFGIAKVIGGNFNVLATDVYKQVIGQQNFQMGAVVGMVLLAPAVLAFLVDAGPAQAGGAAVGARRALSRGRSWAATCLHCLLRCRGHLHRGHARHGGVGLVHAALALQFVADPGELRFR